MANKNLDRQVNEAMRVLEDIASGKIQFKDLDLSEFSEGSTVETQDENKDDTTEGEQPKRKVREITFEDRCDMMLMDMENGDFTSLGRMTMKESKEIQNQILKYYEDEEELRRTNKSMHHILQRVIKATPQRKARAARKTKSQMTKKIAKLELAAEWSDLKSGAQVEALFDEQYNEFAFLNIKYGELLVIEVSGERWKGDKTFLGKVRKISISQKEAAGLTRLRTGDRMLEEALSGRKRTVYEDTSIRMGSNVMLLKAMKRTD